MLHPQLFSEAALHAARGCQQAERRGAEQPEVWQGVALEVSLDELARLNPEIHRFVIERFIARALPLPIAIALGLVVSRFLLALPLQEVRHLTLQDRLLRTWYLFRGRPEAENLYRREVLARISPVLLIQLEHELAWTTERLERLGIGRGTFDVLIAFGRTIVLTALDSIYCATRALDD